MAVPHLPFDLSLGDHRGDRVDHHDIDRAGPNERLGDLERLLTGVRLGDKQRVDIHAERLRIDRIKRVLHVNKDRRAARLLRLCRNMERHCRFARAFRTVDFNDAAFGHASDSERDVERQ